MSKKNGERAASSSLDLPKAKASNETDKKKASVVKKQMIANPTIESREYADLKNADAINDGRNAI